MATVARRLRRRGQRWISRRVRRQPGPISVQRKNLYILPTRAGLVFALLLLVMLLGAMNYSNSLAFMLTFLLAALALVSMHHTHRNLLKLQVHPGPMHRVFAGDKARYEIVLYNASRQPRYSIRLEAAENGYADIPPFGNTTLRLETDSPRRGRLPAPRFKLVTEYPLGLFRAWTWMELEMNCLVYPRPLRDREKERVQTYGTRTSRIGKPSGGGDFSGLRDYRRGDSPQRIHWRASAHSQELQVKQFAEPEDETLWLDWDQFPGMAAEERLSRLCFRVLSAHHAGIHYGLKLPGRHIRPAADEGHMHRCLEALALFRSGNKPPPGDRAS